MGNLERTPETIAIKTIYSGTPIGKRSPGRFWQRYLDNMTHKSKRSMKAFDWRRKGAENASKPP